MRMLARRRAGQLLHSEILVAVNAAEPQHGSLIPGQAPDDVVRGAQRDVGVVRIGRHFQQHARAPIGLPQMVQTLDLPLLDQEEIVRLHALDQRERKQRIGVLGLLLQTRAGHLLPALHRRSELPFEIGIRFALDSAEQPLVVEEKVGRQHALAIELLEKVGSRLHGRPGRFGGPLLLPLHKPLAGLVEFQLVEKLKSAERLGIVHHAGGQFRAGIVRFSRPGLRARAPGESGHEGRQPE